LKTETNYVCTLSFYLTENKFFVKTW